MSMLTPTQEQIREDARAFVAKEIIPIAARFDATGEFPLELLQKARASNVLAMAVPKAFGGLEYDGLTQALVYEAWGYGCAGMTTTMSCNSLSMDALLVAGTDDQKRMFSEPMLRGELGSFGLTEPSAGSDAGNSKTTAVREGDEYVLNGSKCWITNGGYASIFVIFALTDPAAGMKGISAFLVEKATPGFSIGTVDHKMGIRTSNTVELMLRDVRVPASNLVGQEGDGMKIAMKTLDMARPTVAAMSVGLAQRALDECVKHLRKLYPEKAQPGQTLQFKLADMRMEIEAARQLLHHTMILRDAGLPYTTESAMSKTFCSDMAMRVTAQAVQLMGSHGYCSELGKWMRDAKIMQIYEGTNQIQRLVIARGLLAPARPAQKGGH